MHDLTIREMRQLLTAMNRQDMTIDELRHALFDIEDQDQPFVNLLNAGRL